MSQAFRALVGSDRFADSFGYLNSSDDALRTFFAGASEPAGPIAYQLWVDTTNSQLKMRNAQNNAWIILGSVGLADLGHLPLAGGTLGGSLNMGGNQITNLALGTGTAAARQQEVDLKAALAAPQFTGDARVNQDPAGDNSLIRRIWSEGRYLKLSGGTMTGALLLFGNATAALHPIPLQQLQTFLGFSTTAGHRHDGADSRRIRGTDIDAVGSTSGQLLKSNGALAAWATNTPPVILDTALTQLFTGTSSGGFVTADLTALVPTSAEIAILKVQFVSRTDGTPATARYVVLTLRKQDAAVGVDYSHRILGEDGQNFTITIEIQVAVPLNARQFDYRLALTGSSSGVLATGWLVGYLNSIS